MLTSKIRKKRTFSLNKGTGFVSRHPIGFLNVTQLLGALNDNLFKFLSIYFLIDKLGVSASHTILFWIGVVFVLPFLFFSSSGGILADSYSKQKLIVGFKAFEIAIIGYSFFVFYFQLVWPTYVLVGMLSLQSALFGPSKYSIVPELVGRDKITKANSLLTSSTYLAIIVGTFLASFLTDIFHKNFLLVALVCFIFSLIGFASSLFIPHTEARKSAGDYSRFFIKQTYKTLYSCKVRPDLLVAVIGSAFFLFVGGFLQLNMIPFAMESLGLDEVKGGYLFLVVAVGIAVGAFISGKLCKKRVEVGLSLCALALLSFLLLVIFFVSHSLASVIILLGLSGIFGGMFVVPLESYIQSESEANRRGQIFAASNGLSFLFLLFVPLCLFIFSSVLGLSAAHAIFLMGVINIIVFFLMQKTLASEFFYFVARCLCRRFYDTYFIGKPFDNKKKRSIVLMPFVSWMNLFLLFAQTTKGHLFYFKEKRGGLDFIFRLFGNVEIYYFSEKKQIIEEFIHFRTALKKRQRKCASFDSIIAFSSKEVTRKFFKSRTMKMLQEDKDYSIQYLIQKHETHFGGFTEGSLKRKQITYQLHSSNPNSY